LILSVSPAPGTAHVSMKLRAITGFAISGNRLSVPAEAARRVFAAALSNRFQPQVTPDSPVGSISLAARPCRWDGPDIVDRSAAHDAR
jgi:hypothetical protein